MHKKIKDLLSGLSGVLLVLLVTGLGFLIAGSYHQNSLLQTIGGTAIGASISALIGSWNFVEIREDIVHILSSINSPGLTSQDSDIAQYKKRWHSYFLTELEGKDVWRYAVIDFSKNLVPGLLITELSSSARERDGRLFRVEGFARDDRFVIVGKALNSKEPTLVAVYPTMGESFRSMHAGLCFIKTWDANEAVSKALVSERPIADWSQSGTVSEDAALKLDEEWDRHFNYARKYTQ